MVPLFQHLKSVVLFFLWILSFLIRNLLSIKLLGPYRQDVVSLLLLWYILFLFCLQKMHCNMFDVDDFDLSNLEFCQLLESVGFCLLPGCEVLALPIFSFPDGNHRTWIIGLRSPWDSVYYLPILCFLCGSQWMFLSLYLQLYWMTPFQCRTMCWYRQVWVESRFPMWSAMIPQAGEVGIVTSLLRRKSWLLTRPSLTPVWLAGWRCSSLL